MELDATEAATVAAAVAILGASSRLTSSVAEAGLRTVEAGIRQPVFPEMEHRALYPTARPVSTMHESICEWIDFHDKKNIPESEKAPKQFMCPLSLHAMRDPVSCDDGHVYERAHIQAWREAPDSGGRSPLTRALMSEHMFCCTPLVSMMEAWVLSKITLKKSSSLEDTIRAHLGPTTWEEMAEEELTKQELAKQQAAQETV